ncbi:agmatine deiminase family protein [Paludibacter sp.]
MNIRLPAEWERQRFIQLTWPHEGTDWSYMIDEVNKCFVEIAKNIVQFEDLLIVCKDEVLIRKLLRDIDTSKIRFAELPSNDTWARDHGGITILKNGQRCVCDFTFNGWGKKYASELDNKITAGLFRLGVFGEDTIYTDCSNLVLEGGSIESDGNGTLLTTSTCLLSANRNDMSKEEIEVQLKSYFGLERVLWLNHGYLTGDDTDSHIDTLARFCDENTIAYVKCDDKNDEHYEELRLMETELQVFKTKDGKSYNLVALPMADAVFFGDERLPATYANFLILNDAVLVPIYNSPKDNVALKTLQEVFGDRKVLGINCLPLIKQHGSLHCVTMQYV